ncbi:hypothetical protein KPH14_008200 [Odynerus spinipes]|uniref:Protein CUSTOS n=1 Tax=Odynerus spinipes TaxID=1348599 RepID=A0AAD9RHL1_9HYME|nr:hypothetical protein KPH14_008200 [Odynerus spinipes]
MLNTNTSEMECSSSEDEITVKALKEAADIDFLKPALFSVQKNTEAFESNKNPNNTNTISLRKKVQEEDNFYNFGVTTTFKTYVAKKLDTLLERTIQLDEENSKTSTIIENKDKSNGNCGIYLLSSSTNLLLTDEDVPVESKNHKKRKKIIKEVTTDVSQFKEAAIDPERILSKIETKAWAERHKGSVFKYKKLKNGTLIEQD